MRTSMHHIPDSSIKDAQIRQQALAVQLQYDIAFAIAALPAGALAPCTERSYRAIRACITRCDVHKQADITQMCTVKRHVNFASCSTCEAAHCSDQLQCTDST
jgi:hypothetical protein